MSPVEKLYGLVENGKSMVELQEIDGPDFWDCMLEFGPVLEYILNAETGHYKTRAVQYGGSMWIVALSLQVSSSAVASMEIKNLLENLISELTAVLR